MSRCSASTLDISAGNAFTSARSQGKGNTPSPEDRYRALQGNAADALARLAQGDIARFLGITPIAFSRIKRRMAASS